MRTMMGTSALRCTRLGLAAVLLGAFLLSACGLATRPSPTNPPTALPTAAAVPPADLSPAVRSLLARYAPLPHFRTLSVQDGLSQSVVNAIAQDQQGFLWFATQEGLNRYDGYEFKVYKNHPNDPNSLPGSFINTLAVDRHGGLWVGTSTDGAARLDPRTGAITHYAHDPANPNGLSSANVNEILVGSDGAIWFTVDGAGVDRLDPATGKFTHYWHDEKDPNTLASNSVIALLEDRDGILWIGTAGYGLDRLDPKTARITHYRHDPEDPDSLAYDAVQSLLEDRQGRLWCGTIDGGLDLFDREAGVFIHHQHQAADPATIGSGSVNELLEDRQGRIWVGMAGSGVNLLDPETGRFTRFPVDPKCPTCFPSSQVSALFEDRSGMIWIGTFGSGVSAYDPAWDKFSILRPVDSGLSNTNIIWSVYEDPDGRLWIGTHGSGLSRYDPNTGKWRTYTAENSGLKSDVVYAIFEDRERGGLWLGTSMGLFWLDPKKELFESVGGDPPVFAIRKDPDGSLWLGTASTGLVHFSPETKAWTAYRHDPADLTSLGSNSVYGVAFDGQGRLWAGTAGGGLNRYDPASDSFVHYVSDPANPATISDNSVLSIHPAADGTLWLATTGGLNHFNPQTGAFRAYREADGLANDFVYGMLEDGRGRLWISTNRGLSRLDPATGVFRSFKPSDGLQSNEFNQGAFHQNREGVMYFGGVDGLNIFHPDAVVDNPYAPPVVITGLTLFNQPVEPGADSPLQGPVEQLAELTLQPGDNFFEFQFAALSYSLPGENQYAYKMDNLDADWHVVGDRRFATYTNMPPGEYTLRVRASNSDGVWNDQGTAVRIHIPPPFYQTLWFRLAAIAVTVGLVAGAVSLRVGAVERQRRRLELLVQERTGQLQTAMQALGRSKDEADTANRAKSAFLANMSHEFRTPLNAILGFSQVLLRDGRLLSDQRSTVDIIHRSSEHLLSLINDVLDMSKIEAGRTILRQTPVHLRSMLAGLEDLFVLRAAKKGLRLTFDVPADLPAWVAADEAKLRQVLLNLLGNAVKFSVQGEVRLRVQSTPLNGDGEAASVTFSVEDSGPGIPPAEQAQLFTPFYQAGAGQQAQEGTGLGLAISHQYVRLMGGELTVESELGVGSAFRFTLRLPLAEEPPEDALAHPRRVIGLQPGQPTYRVLVVDDNEVMRALLANLLQPLGFALREAEHGAQAVEIAREWQPHLVWMDMRMPVMDGYQATKAIKAERKPGGTTPIIIALTASGMENEKSSILSHGCDDYLRKPFREEELFACIERHLDVRFIYAEEVVRPVSGPPPARLPEADALATRLARLDPDCRQQLRLAAELGDERELARAVEAIRAGDAEAGAALKALAENFDHDGILALVRQAEQADSHGTNRPA